MAPHGDHQGAMYRIRDPNYQKTLELVVFYKSICNLAKAGCMDRLLKEAFMHHYGKFLSNNWGRLQKDREFPEGIKPSDRWIQTHVEAAEYYSQRGGAHGPSRRPPQRVQHVSEEGKESRTRCLAERRRGSRWTRKGRGRKPEPKERGEPPKLSTARVRQKNKRPSPWPRMKQPTKRPACPLPLQCPTVQGGLTQESRMTTMRMPSLRRRLSLLLPGKIVWQWRSASVTRGELHASICLSRLPPGLAMECGGIAASIKDAEAKLGL